MSLAELPAVIADFTQQATVVTVQAVSIIDHVAPVTPDVLRSLIKDDLGGSHRVDLAEVRNILAVVGEFLSKPGGSASNFLRALAGFGIGARLVGARGQDEWGAIYHSSMKRAGVDMERVMVKEGTTGRCCILTCEGQRTMRTCMQDAARLQKEEVIEGDFANAAWAYLSAYCLYSEGLLSRAVELARAAGCRIALDLGSFEIVRAFRTDLVGLIESGQVDLCFCNEDEAVELVGGGAVASPESALHYLAQHCDIAVVTLGDKGCLVQQGGAGGEVIALPAVSDVTIVDSTGAGDTFAAGFIHSLISGFSLRRAAEVGCMAGAAVVQVLGSELGPAQWQWLHQKLHGERAGEAVRSSAAVVQRELLHCYALIERKGRGVVYYGSARLKEGSTHWDSGRKLGHSVSSLLGSTTWSGGGPGLMQAATLGAMDAGAAVAGIRIAREAGTTVRSASYLPEDSAVVCRFLSSRKVALVDAGVREREDDRTAFIFLPGGLGTLDELFELLTLVQLKKLGTKFPVPVILCNFPAMGAATDPGYYEGIIAWLTSCEALGTIGTPEMRDLLVASSIEDVLHILRVHYSLGGTGEGRVCSVAEWAAQQSAGNGTTAVQ